MGQPNPLTDWDAIRDLYCRSDLTVQEIAAAAGVARSTLRKRAIREGWPPRKRGRAGRDDGKAEPTPAADTLAQRSALMLMRLHRSLDAQLAAVEKQGRARDMTPEQRDRAARTMATLTRTLEKIVDLEQRLFRPAAPNTQDDHETRDDPLAELERRLASLLAENNTTDVPGEPEPG